MYGTGTLDDATSFATALAIRSLTLDPFELTTSSGLLAASALSTLMIKAVPAYNASSADAIAALPDALGQSVIDALLGIIAASHAVSASEANLAVTVASFHLTAGTSVLYFGNAPSSLPPPLNAVTFGFVKDTLAALSRRHCMRRCDDAEESVNYALSRWLLEQGVLPLVTQYGVRLRCYLQRRL